MPALTQRPLPLLALQQSPKPFWRALLAPRLRCHFLHPLPTLLTAFNGRVAIPRAIQHRSLPLADRLRAVSPCPLLSRGDGHFLIWPNTVVIVAVAAGVEAAAIAKAGSFLDTLQIIHHSLVLRG